MRQSQLARRQGQWDLRAAGNFIGGGTGTGLVVAATVAAALPGAHVVLAVPVIVGMLFVIAGLSLVWLEIGKPWRALNVFFHPQTSWMTREAILAGPLVVCCAATAWTGAPALLAPSALLAAGFVYCQARMLRASRAIPAWSHPRTVALTLATAAAEGTGAFVVLGGADSTAMLALALLATLAREAAHEALRRGLVASNAPAGTLEWFERPLARALLALRIVAALLMLVALVGVAGAASPLLAAAGGAIAVLTGWALKAILITRMAFMRGARIARAPARGRGEAAAVMPAQPFGARGTRPIR
jgi:phenylacetyl-CoA:acceptor oxidoreductase subunit 2